MPGGDRGALPFFLAGPIVRRVSAREVWVWAAVSRPGPLTLLVSDLSNAGLSPPAAEQPRVLRAAMLRALVGRSGPADVRRVTVTPRLHVVLLRARPPPHAGRFPTRRLLTYGIVAGGAEGASLASAPGMPELLAEGGQPGDAYAYALFPREERRRQDRRAAAVFRRLPLPGFVIPDVHARQLTVLYGSCRKPHGAGGDAAPGLLWQLRRLRREPADALRDRPVLLALTGDQIYADDVAEEALCAIHNLAGALYGRRDRSFGGAPVPEGLGCHRSRARVAAGQAGFTSGAAGRHLLSFPEFAGMYLYAWNPLLARRFTRGSPPWLASYLRGGEALQKVFANVPAYMMFDDHEVTDDWNLDLGWMRRVYGRVFGSWVVANGLAAFVLFQGWGNDPDRVPGSLLRAIEAYVRAQEGRDARMPETQGRAAAALREAILGQRDWTVRAPAHTPVILVDTRTTRRPSGIRRVTHYYATVSGHPAPRPRVSAISRPAGRLPDILGEAGASLGRLLRARPGGPDDPPIVCLATPPLGFWLAELAQAFSPERLDFESWVANPHSLLHLLRRLLVDGRAGEKEAPVILLCGDVHYAYRMQAVARLRWAGRSHRAQLWQLTSSAMKNELRDGDQAGVLGAALGSAATESVAAAPTRIRDELAEVFMANRACWLASVPPWRWSPLRRTCEEPDAVIEARLLMQGGLGGIVWRNNVGVLHLEGPSVRHALLVGGGGRPRRTAVDVIR